MEQKSTKKTVLQLPLTRTSGSVVAGSTGSLIMFLVVLYILPADLRYSIISLLPDAIAESAAFKAITPTTEQLESDKKVNPDTEQHLFDMATKIEVFSNLWHEYNGLRKDKTSEPYKSLSYKIQTEGRELEPSVNALYLALILKDDLKVSKEMHAFSVYNIAWYYFIVADINNDSRAILRAEQSVNKLDRYHNAKQTLNTKWTSESEFFLNSKLLKMQIYMTKYTLDKSAANEDKLFNLLFEATVAEKHLDTDSHYSPYYKKFINKLHDKVEASSALQ